MGLSTNLGMDSGLASPLRNALMGPGNESFDAARILLAIGAGVFIVFYNVFQGVDLFVNGNSFDPIAYGTGFGLGLGGILAAGAGGISLKDRGVARAQATAAESKAQSE